MYYFIVFRLSYLPAHTMNVANILFFCLYSFHVFCTFNVLRAPRKMGECSLGSPV